MRVCWSKQGVKAYRLYNLETKKIIISRDVRFDESKKWEWEEISQDNGLRWEETVTESDTEGGEEDQNTGEEETEVQPEEETETEEVNA